jgi:acetoacetyl-CoA synthetase
VVKPLWSPSQAQCNGSALDQFRRAAGKPDYRSLHRWSVESRDSFWAALWEFAGIVGDRGAAVAHDLERMPGTRWFPDARLNFAENLLRRRDTAPALIHRDEPGGRAELSFGELADSVASVAAHLRDAGLQSGDRVAAIVPNRIETVIMMLATTALGGVWSSCSPDFGAAAIIDRFGQIAPTLLVGCEGYAHGGKWFDCTAWLADVASRLPTLRKTIVIRTAADPADLDPIPHACTFDTLLGHASPYRGFVRLPFDAPLYIMFSSGTTGAPKCIVHGIGGTLLQHQKEQLLHCDLKFDERLLFFTTCGWMMWNWLVSGLAAGAAVCLYDGSPFFPDHGVLFRFVEEEAVNHLGISPGFLSTLAKAHYSPRRHHELRSVRSILSTGSPLPAESFVWAYDNLAKVRLSSITGGTDIMGCFALGNPILPVYAGEIQSAGLGMALAFYDDAGRPLATGKGELVCTRSFPSMPIGFWNDPDGTRYQAAYFERFPGAWHHGDYGEFTANDGVIIHGRSDAILNRGGVRIGTAEIYRQIETLDEVLECIAVGREQGADLQVLLFVRLKAGIEFDAALEQRIKQTIRVGTSPRHVPDLIVPVPDIPRTRSGKLVELAVRDVINGREVKNVGALANPEALDHFRNLGRGLQR